MSTIQVNHIKGRVKELFDGKIDLADVKADAANLENHFLTRGLAAYAIQYLARADVDASAAAVTDGTSDNGIDAVYYDERDKRFYIVQSKWIHNGIGEPSNADIKKFVGGVKDLFNPSFDRFNEKIQSKKEMITRALTDPYTKYEIIIAHTGNNDLAEPSVRDLKDLSDEMNDSSEVLSITVLKQADLHKSLTAAISGEPINLPIGIKSWGKIDSPHVAYYGQVNGAEVADWWRKYRARLFQKNLRSVLGETDVNSEIRDTVDKSPDHFWYFNNGITIVCQKVAKTMVGGAETAFGTFHCDDISIVNGAQTVAAIGRYADAANENIKKIQVHVRIISLENGSANFGSDITKTNNTQNRIENRDFVSLDSEQNRIKTELAIDKLEYQIIRSESYAKSDTSFDLTESTTALACASGNVNLVVQLKREIGKLWENIEKAPYRELFNASITGAFVWRCVQVQRKIDLALSGIVNDLGVDSGRDYGIAVHGNRLIAALVFRKFGVAKFNNQGFDFDSATAQDVVSGATQSFYTKLRDQVSNNYGNAILPTLFKNLTKCKDLVTLCES
jgi:hypothetical protein